MSVISLSPEELIVLRKAVETCTAKCRSRESIQGCEDCKTLDKILLKLKEQ